MNKIRRKALSKIVEEIEALKDMLSELQEEEEEYRDNMPENLQGSERYEKADEAVSYMEDAFNALDEALDNIVVAMD